MITSLVILGISYIIYEMLRKGVNMIKKIATYVFIGLTAYVLVSMLLKFILRVMGLIP